MLTNLENRDLNIEQIVLNTNKFQLNLDNLSKFTALNPNEKIYVDIDNNLHIDDRYFLWFRRYIEGTSREDMIPVIKEIYMNLFKYIELPRILANKTEELKNYLIKIKDIKKHILDSLIGLKILQKTYNNDYKKLNSLIEWVENTIKNIVISYSIGNPNNSKDYNIFLKDFFTN